MGFLDLPGLQYFYNKYVKGLKSHAFRDPANNLTTTASGYALDARQGKALDDKVTQLNSALADIVTPKAFSDWGLTNPGNQNTRFTNAEAKNIDELIFVLQGTRNDEVAYEYVNIKTPFSMMQDAYYCANTTAGKLEIYYSSTSGIVDVRQLPLALRQILYVKY